MSRWQGTWRYFITLLVLAIVLVACGTKGTGPRPQPGPTSPPPRLYVEPDDGRTPLLTLLNSARTTINLTAYLITDEPTVVALERAAARGVAVRVLLESAPYGGGKQNARIAQRLRSAGVAVRFTSPSFRYTHQKSVVVDNRTGLIMTHNLTRSAFSRNREYGVILHDWNLVEEMNLVYQADWERTPPDFPGPPRLIWSPINARQALLELIQSAREQLDLEHQNLLDREITDALVAAAARGVTVRLLMPTPEENEWPNVNRLRVAGGQVAFMDKPRVHAKVLVVDRQKALVGSMNLTTTSLDLNRELGVVLTAPEVLVPLLATMGEDWKRATARRESRPPLPPPARESPPSGLAPPGVSWEEAEQRVAPEQIRFAG